MSASYSVGKNRDLSVYLLLILLCFTHFAEYNVVCKFMSHLKTHYLWKERNW